MAAASGHEIVAHSSQLLRLIPLFPLIGASINFLLGRRIQAAAGRGAVAGIATLMPVLSFAVVVMSFLQLRGYDPSERLILDHAWKWIHIGTMQVDIAFQFDPLSAVMCLIITGIGSLIHLYSYGYMDDEPAAWRFFALLNLFLFAMLCLVLGDNFLLMFLGWEGVGLCSWGLIGFWYSEMANARAGNKAFIVNRVGDFGFTLGVFLLFWTLNDHGHGTLVFREIAQHVHLIEGDMLWGWSVATLVTLFLFVGATGKSAQIPLYVWLPDAMAGPTPVSALIHAATMVTAGVYLIARTNWLFDMAPFTGQVVATIGALTAFFAATIGLAQNDIKKVLAYSTVSQLGYMFIAVGVGAYAAGVFHLMTHAFFKACLFLGSGSIIHAMHHEQDMRNMGGLRKYMPRTWLTFLIATIAIAGFPPLAGFFSKDEILWKAWEYSPMIWGLGFAAAAMTSFYMFRLYYMTFEGECRADHHTVEHLHESSGYMTIPLIVLALGSCVVGFLGMPPSITHFVGGANFFEHWLEPVMAHHAHHGHHEIPPIEYVLMAASVGIATLGWLLARAMYGSHKVSPDGFARIAGGSAYNLIYNKYYIDEIYQVVWVNGSLGLARMLAWFDQKIVDGIVNGAAAVTRMVSAVNGAFDSGIIDGLVNATASIVQGFGGAVRRVQTGSINAYLYVIVAVVTAVLFARTW